MKRCDRMTPNCQRRLSPLVGRPAMNERAAIGPCAREKLQADVSVRVGVLVSRPPNHALARSLGALFIPTGLLAELASRMVRRSPRRED